MKLKAKSLKILIFSLAYYPEYVGGAEVAIKEITDRIPEEEASFDMITAKRNFRQKRFEKIGNVNVYRVGLGFEFFDKFSIPIFGFFKAIFLQRKNGYNLSWSMMANQASVAASFFKFFFRGIPLILTIQEGDEEEHLKRYVFGNEFLYKILIRPWHKMPFKLANRATAISFYLKERVERNNFKGIIEIIPNGVDFESFSKNYSEEELLAFRKNLGIKKDDKIIITTSRLVEKNAVEDIILSLKYLPKKYKLLILGTGHLLYRLQNLTDKEGLSNRVSFLGFIEREEIPKYLKVSDVFVRPSLSEGMGNSFIEAMASGIPVIGTAVGGITDFMRDKETGLFCEVRNPESIASKIKLLEKDVVLRESIILNAENLSKDYSWDLIAEMMLNRAFLGFSKDYKRIVIATGIYPPQVGGPAYYALNLSRELRSLGHRVSIATYGWEGKLPTGFRHIAYFVKLLLKSVRKDFVIALDTISVGLPSIWVKKILGTKFLIRIGGDFLWESFVRDEQKEILLSDFYNHKDSFYGKNRRIFNLTKYVLHNVSALIFSTKYQQDIFTKAYDLDTNKNYIVENNYPSKIQDSRFKIQDKNYLWAGRDIPLKNTERLKRVFEEAGKVKKDIRLDLLSNISKEELMEKMKESYAVILPSLSEISPNFITEAISLNKPFICTRETGYFDRLKDIGLFVDPLSEEDIKEKILWLSDDENYEKQKEKIRNFNFQHSYKEIAKEILEISEKI
jgi:glycosyltransferase involved in cell wall biosynthesis